MCAAIYFRLYLIAVKTSYYYISIIPGSCTCDAISFGNSNWLGFISCVFFANKCNKSLSFSSSGSSPSATSSILLDNLFLLFPAAEFSLCRDLELHVEVLSSS